MRKQYTVTIEYNPYEDAKDPIDPRLVENTLTNVLCSLNNDYEIDDFISIEVTEL